MRISIQYNTISFGLGMSRTVQKGKVGGLGNGKENEAIVTSSHKRGLKSILSLLIYWYSKKVQKMELNLIFESSL